MDNTMPYRIYVDRGNGLEIDGCWGSEHAQFESLHDAKLSAHALHAIYSDCAWTIVDESTGEQVYKIMKG